MKIVDRQKTEFESAPVEHSGLNCRTDGQLTDSEHGGNIYKIAEELGISEEELIDFSASINPLGISAKVKEVIKSGLNGLVNYPDPDSVELRKKIAFRQGIEEETIICGNGSTELIYLMPRVLKPRNVLITAPAFSEYERACVVSQELGVKSYELKEKDGFAIAPHMFIEKMQDCDMAFLCNPNNPTGGLLSRREVLEMAGAANDAKCYLVLDEAFIDFRPEDSVLTDVKENPYLIVLRSMTKFYALTGLRIGYGVFHEDIIEKVKAFKEPWTVNNLAQKAAVTALEDSQYENETHRLMAQEKTYMEKSFVETGIKYYPSAANYYLLKVRDAKSKVLKLRQKGLLVRDCSNFKGLESTYIRVAVKSHEQNEKLIREMKKI